jgi:hypothetical protein
MKLKGIGACADGDDAGEEVFRAIEMNWPK